MSDEHPLEDIFERAINDTPDENTVSLADLMKLFGDRTFGPVFLMLGLLVVIPPIGAIPILPAIIGIIASLFAVQVLIGRKHIWLPGFLLKMSIEKDTLRAAHDRAHKWLARIDRLITHRLEFLTGSISRRLASLIVILLGLSMIPLEVVPFAVAIPGWGIALIGAAFIARDGILMLLAYLAFGATAWFGVTRFLG